MGVYGGPNKAKGGIVFGLDGANHASYAGDTPTTAGTNYGYFGAGRNPSFPAGLSSIDRVDYSNDTPTAASKGNLTDSKNWRGGTSSLTHGYIAGGYPGAVTTNNRIDYSNDTATAATKGPLSAAVNYMVATGNTSYGYWGSGREGSPFVSSVDRLDYSNDTATMSPKGPLVASHNYRMATGNLSYGYWSGGGGNGPPSITSVDRLDYSSDTTTAVAKGPLSETRYMGAATGNGDYGYIAGGMPSPYKSSIDRIDYSNDTATAASGKGPLSVARTSFGDAATGTDDYGYFGGGYKAYARISTIDRLDYSSDTTTASVRGPMNVERGKSTAVGSRAYGFPTTGNPATRSTTQINGTPYGYVAHGLGSPANPSPQVSTTNRIDFSNDTATAVVTGNQTQSAYYSKGVGNNNYGYILSAVPSNNTVASRIDYSNDSAACAPKGPLAYGAWEAGATGNASYGYHGGGYDQAASTRTSKVQRLDYSSDTTTAVVKGPLAATHYRTAATGNLSYGYWGGGDNPGNSSLISRVDYSSDTPTASSKGPLDFVVSAMAAVGNQTHGYWGGGETPSVTSKVQRLEWASDTTTASTKGPLSAAKKMMTAMGSDSYGYVAGGNVWPNTLSIVDRIDYSSDTTTASPKGYLTFSLYGQASVSSQENALGSEAVYLWNDISGRGNNANITDSRFRSTDGGYFTFDGTGDFLTVPSTNAFAFGTGDFSVEYWVRTPASGTNFGYFGGGYNPSRVQSGINRIDFSNDTATASQISHFAGASPSGRNQLKRLFGVASSTHAYWGGGTHSLGSESTSIFRLDLSNDTTNTSAIGNLSAVGSDFSAVGNASYGYINGDSKTRVDRIDYSNDDTTTAVKGDLNQTRSLPGATGNSSYGWFGGGGYSRSSVDRIDYSNDTATASPRGDLNRNNVPESAATGNANFGYWGGGGPGTTTYVDRVDYSNDTASATPKGPLSVARDKHGATGNSDYGYFAGGQPGPLSSVERIDFSNDTATAAPKGSLNITPGINGKDYLAGASSKANGFSLVNAANIINPDSETGSGYWAHQYDTTFDWNSKYDSAAGPAFAYWLGGDDGDTTWYSIVDRVDYSNDTATASPKGSLDDSKRGGGGVSSKTHGYAAGGSINNSGDHSSKVSRIDYANDTATASTVGNLATSDTAFNGAVGTTSYGYINIGRIPSGTTNIERIDYSSDSSTATPKGNLDVVRMYLGAAGNQSYGYFGGGFGPGYSGPHSSVQRIEYASDTSTAVVKGPLSYTRNALSAASNSSHVYFGGGFNPVSSQVSRIDISNDTPTAVDKGPLNTGRFALEATGTTSFGYFGGGRPTSGTIGTVVDRIDYSNDTPTASPKGPLSAARRYCPAVSALANAFPTGSTELYTCALSPVNDGDWHNVVITRVGGTQQAYYDGVGITTTGGTYTDGTDYSGVDGWFIGKGNPAVSGGTAFSGDLANITIRKGKGLSSDEVQQNFNALRSRFGV